MAKTISTYNVAENTTTHILAGQGPPPSAPSMSYTTWAVTVADTNNQAITASSNSFSVSYPTIYAKRTNNVTNKPDAAANFKCVLKNASGTVLWTMYVRRPEDVDDSIFSSVFKENAQIQIYKKKGYDGSKSLTTSTYFNANNKTAKTVNLTWTVSLEAGSASSSSAASAETKGLWSFWTGAQHTVINNKNVTGIRKTYRYTTTAKTTTWTVPVTLSAPPSITANSTTLGNPKTTSSQGYATHTPYTVNYSATAQYGGSISSVKLSLGSYSTTISNTASGNISVTPGAAGTYTPTLLVTDSRGQTTTKTLSAVTYVAAGAPTVTATTPVSSTTNGFWRGVSKLSSSITASSAINGGYVSSFKITVGTLTGTVTNTTTGSVTKTPQTPVLTTAGSFVPQAVVTDNYNHTTTKSLSSIVVKEPTISVTSDCSRIGSNDLPADEGTSCLITAKFVKSDIKTGTTQENYLLKPNVYLGTNIVITDCVVWYATYSKTNGFSNAVNWTSPGYDVGASVTLYGKLSTENNYYRSIDTSVVSGKTYYTYSNGTYTEVASPTGNPSTSNYYEKLQPFNKNNSYVIGIEPKSTLIATGTRSNGILQAAFYLIAARAGGRGLGIGLKPLSDAFYIGIPTFIQDELTIDTGSSAHFIIKTQVGNTTTYEPRRVLSVYDDGDNVADGQIIRIGAGGNVIIGAGESAIDAPTASVMEGIWMNNLNNIRTSTQEDIYLTADGSIYFYTGVAQNASSYNLSSISTTGILTVPNDIIAGKWAANTAQSEEYASYVFGGSGKICMYVSPGNTAGKGLWVANAAGTGKTIISVDQNNNATFTGSLSGNATSATSATKATQDANGSAIASTYLKLSGGTMTGNLTMTWTKHIYLGTGETGIYGGSYEATRNIYYNAPTANSYHAFYAGGNAAFYIYGDKIQANKPFTKLETTGNCVVSGTGTFTGTTTTDSSANARVGTGSPVGRIYRYASSSRRFKHDIQPLTKTDLDPHQLYDLPVRQFKYNIGYLDFESPRVGLTVPGFIAEEMYDIYPIAVDLDDEKRPEDWNIRYVVPPMLALIQEQHQEIEELKERISILEEK